MNKQEIEKVKEGIETLIMFPFNGRMRDDEASKIEGEYRQGLKNHNPMDVMLFKKLESTIGNLTEITLENIDGDWRQYIAYTDRDDCYVYFITEPDKNNVHVITCINIFDNESGKLQIGCQKPNEYYYEE